MFGKNRAAAQKEKKRHEQHHGWGCGIAHFRIGLWQGTKTQGFSLTTEGREEEKGNTVAEFHEEGNRGSITHPKPGS